MNTEITEIKKCNGWVLYDAQCRLCVGLAGRSAALLASQGFELLPLQTPWVETQLRLDREQLLTEMRLLLPDGRFFGGADAVLEISRSFWWAWPLHAMGRIETLRTILHAGYAWLARHRSCVRGVCGIGSGHRDTAERHRLWIVGVIPLLVLPSVALLVGDRLTAWVFMWAMAFALYAGCKWVTWWNARRNGVDATRGRTLGYLLAWPGMDAATFLGVEGCTTKPRGIEWLFGFGKLVCGVISVWVFARRTVLVSPLLAGWVGMIGLVFVLHFGVFHLLSLAWRNAGINAPPIMLNPLRASSLADLWGRRWNTAFHELAHRFTFRPMRRVMGSASATLLVFLLPGLVHELVIWLPARGGYGLPAGYFFVQGLGVVAEHTRLAGGSVWGAAGAAGCSPSRLPPVRRSGCFIRCSSKESSCQCFVPSAQPKRRL